MVSTIGLIITNLVVDHGPNTFLRFVGLVLLLSSPFFFIPPFIVLAKAGKPGKHQTYMETSMLVRQGPFRIIRHPQYLGYIFLNLGFAFLAQFWIAFIFAAISISIFIAISIEEEKHLRARFGDEYAEYCQDVPRFNVIVGLMRYVKSLTQA